MMREQDARREAYDAAFCDNCGDLRDTIRTVLK